MNQEEELSLVLLKKNIVDLENKIKELENTIESKDQKHFELNKEYQIEISGNKTLTSRVSYLQSEVGKRNYLISTLEEDIKLLKCKINNISSYKEENERLKKEKVDLKKSYESHIETLNEINKMYLDNHFKVLEKLNNY